LKIVAATAALAMLPCLLGATHHVSSLEQHLQDQRALKRSLDQRLQQKRLQLNAAASRVNYWQAQLHQTSSAIGHVDGQLAYLEASQHEMERRLSWEEQQLVEAQRSFKLHDTMLRRRLVGIYEYGEPSYLSVLLEARSFSEFVESWDDLQLLIRADQRVVRERQEAEEHVAAVQRGLEATQLALQDEQNRQTQDRDQLSALASERRNYLGLARNDRNRVAAQMEDLSAQQERVIEEIARAQAAIDAERLRAQGIAGPLANSNGYFTWPVTGVITSPFGWRENPFGGGPEFHQGLDIAAPSGTPVKAAAGGTVIMAQWYGGYGNYILIDNGNGFSTGYAHLSAMYVSKGQYVTRGQPIGAVGSTGYSTGPHLHFEVRIDGKPVDPAPRLIH
jgi:murein DD-endopeptidase MepM/ murein hydrolase activator NlpD